MYMRCPIIRFYENTILPHRPLVANLRLLINYNRNKLTWIGVQTVWKEFGNLNPCAHGFKSVTAPKAGAILGATFYQLI